MDNFKNLKKIAGDASFRNFFRKNFKKSTSIIVYTKKEKYQNLVVYDAINKILKKNKILAPNLLKENYKKNYIEIEDFGINTIFKLLNKKNSNKFIYFKKSLDLLIKLQSIKDKKIKTFMNKTYKIPRYNNQILINEANLFCDWYVNENLPRKKKNNFEKKFKKIVKKLTLSLKQKNNIFVHRDFHVSNLMMVNNKIGVIDSQDALIGNRAYDLASLIDDVRFQTSELFKNKVYKLYLMKLKKIDKYKFKNDFEILSILRNLKIIGIFTRLARRDRKKSYLKLIPYTWSLINMRINKNKIFDDLKNLLDENFKNRLNEN